MNVIRRAWTAHPYCTLGAENPVAWVLPTSIRQRARATWAAGDWDSCARLIEPVGAVVLDRIDVRPGLDLLDVGTGTGGNVAIPAALRGANVVGLDIAPELFEHARRRAADAGVDVEWVEGDAQDSRSRTKRSTGRSRRSAPCSRRITSALPRNWSASAAPAAASR